MFRRTVIQVKIDRAIVADVGDNPLIVVQAAREIDDVAIVSFLQDLVIGFDLGIDEVVFDALFDESHDF